MGLKPYIRLEPWEIQHSLAACRGEDFVLFPKYLGARTEKITIEGMPSELNLWRIFGCVILHENETLLGINGARWETDERGLLHVKPDQLERRF